ncbi:MAG TPA: DMT family transporter [Candidatus Baltobacteraceae bacterium]|jgi:drug/metabolite transporter (DMT)-like permease|nr:DMT family transporter [Candidatus Baltobacteraceae bacterium]
MGMPFAVIDRRLLLYLGLAYTVAAWSLNTIAIKFAVKAMDPLAFTGLRFVLMTPLAFALAGALGERVRIYREDLPLLLACGACGYGVYQYLWVIGLAHTTAFASALLASMAPVITLAIVAFARTERVRSGRWAGALLALFGVAVFEGLFARRITFRIGDALTLGSAGIFAVFNVLSARLVGRYTPVALVAISMAIGTLMILPGAIPRMIAQDWRHVGALDWAILGYATIFPIVLTYPVWSYAISQIGAGRVSMFQFGVPVLTGFLSIPLLHARIDPHEILGAAICIAGMAISQLLGKYSLRALWAKRTVPWGR